MLSTFWPCAVFLTFGDSKHLKVGLLLDSCPFLVSKSVQIHQDGFPYYSWFPFSFLYRDQHGQAHGFLRFDSEPQKLSERSLPAGTPIEMAEWMVSPSLKETTQWWLGSKSFFVKQKDEVGETILGKQNMFAPTRTLLHTYNCHDHDHDDDDHHHHHIVTSSSSHRHIVTSWSSSH